MTWSDETVKTGFKARKNLVELSLKETFQTAGSALNTEMFMVAAFLTVKQLEATWTAKNKNKKNKIHTDVFHAIWMD